MPVQNALPKDEVKEDFKEEGQEKKQEDSPPLELTEEVQEEKK